MYHLLQQIVIQLLLFRPVLFALADDKILKEFGNRMTPEKAVSLFKALEEKFPHKSLGHDKWYLVAVCVARKAL